jgi:type IX secretion system substrate protein
MKPFLLLLILIGPLISQAQITTPIVKANFGVDADLRANYFNALITGASDDWWNNGTAGTGRNVIDSTGAAGIIAGYNSDVSPWPKRMASFWRGMSLPKFTIWNNRLWLDAIFVRDYHGTDTTVFTVASKNGESPAIWTPGIQAVPDKNDILDTYMHIRRAGPNTSDSLWMFGGISMDNVTGNRYFDFELYQTDIYYDRVSQKFYGYGPDMGHTSWKFDAAGNVIKAGDIIFTGAFQSSVLTNIEARIWVSYADWTTVTPAGFTWSGLFDGGTPGAAYGYASIMPNTSGAFYTGLGSVNNTWSGPFGLVLQDNSLAFSGGGPASTTNGKYIADQFIEFSVNLTKLGLDPVTTAGTDICGTPFNRLLIKTRSSASFTADLKDFVAPTDLFLAPRAVAAADVPVYCGVIGVSTIAVQDPYPSSSYTWSTTDGHIVGPNTGSSITVDSPGTYIVAQRLALGCNPYAYDTVTVTFDPNCTTLDHNILNFKGAINNNVTRLDWTIAENKDVSYFEVERSFDGRFFDFVTHVDTSPGIESSASYSAFDDLSHFTAQPAVFYRLKMKKSNGAISYSKTIRIPFGFMLARISIAPNPARDMMQITFNSLGNGVMQMYLYDMSGKAVRTLRSDLQAGVNVIGVDNLSSLQSGMYLVVISTGNEIFRQKVVLAK